MEIPTTRDDPAIGRWGSVDPLAGKYLSISPYNYVYNNPINAFDPDGKEGLFAIRMDMRNKRVLNGQLKAKEFVKEAKQEFKAAASGLTITRLLRLFVYISKNRVIKVETRQARNGGKGVRITKKSGKSKDITKERVKEFEPQPQNPTGKPNQVNFKKNPNKLPRGTSVVKFSKGKKRTPTKRELKFLEKAKDIK